MPPMSTQTPVVSLVVAMARNRVIGRNNALPWRLSEDLKRFKATTMGKPILMGRKTFESIGKPLPGRANLVLTRDRAWQANGVLTVASIEEAVERSRRAPELAVIGGAEVYRLALPLTDIIYLTRVEADVEGDTHFPELDPREWIEDIVTTYPADEKNQYPTTYLTLKRRSAVALPRIATPS
jgi:dihydrofolate reductase